MGDGHLRYLLQVAVRRPYHVAVLGNEFLSPFPAGVGLTVTGESGTIDFRQHPHLGEDFSQPLPFFLGVIFQPLRAARQFAFGHGFFLIERPMAGIALQYFEGCRFRLPSSYCQAIHLLSVIKNSPAGLFVC